MQVRFSPGGDSNILTVAGHGVFKVLRVENLGLKTVQHSLTKRESTVFTAHSWITGAPDPTAHQWGQGKNARTADLRMSLCFLSGQHWTLCG